MAARLGVTPEECVGLTCYRVIHGTDEPPSFCPHRQLLKDGLEHTTEVHEDCLGGDFIVSVSPLYNSEGKLTGCIHVARDINERKQVEEALQESEEKYRNIVETANEGVWIFNSVSETTYVNEKMAEMLGYGREEMVGSFIWDYADEEDKSFFQVKLANRKQGIDEVYELKLMRKDGSYVWLLVSAKAFFDKDGKFAGSLGMFTDITERKEAEEALRLSNIYNRSLIEASLDPLVTIGHDGKITDVNNATEQVTGYSRNDLIGTDFLDYFTEPDKANKGYQTGIHRWQS